MASFVRYDLRDRVAVLTIDNPPVNALGQGVWEAIETEVERAAADPGADAIVLMGAGQTFVAGADINIFSTLKTEEQSLSRSARTHAMLARLEDVPKPLVAAIHGQALGGGLELAMACHFRVATEDARVGQPEVLLGIIPGAGGTQRLPQAGGRRPGARDVHGGQARARPRSPEGRHRGRHRRPGSGRRRHRVREGEGGGRPHPAGARHRRDAGGPGGRSARVRARPLRPREGRQGRGRAVRGRGRDRGRDAAVLRRRLAAGARALRAVRRLDRVPGAAPPLLRRAGRVEGSRRAEGHAGRRRSAAPPSSAPGRWAAASRCRTRTPASRCC